MDKQQPKRHAARIAALSLLYQLDTQDEYSPRDAYLEEALELAAPDLEPEGRHFALRLRRDTALHLERINELLTQASRNWRVERMSRVDRCVLRLAIAELLGHDPPPAAVVINEAVELAKEFGAESSAKFVHGVLAQVVRLVEQGGA